MTRAVQANTIGQPVSISVNDVDPPVPGPGRLVVRVAAGGIGPWDAGIAAGYLGQKPAPLTLGADASGTVEAVGEGVSGFQIGDAVITYPGLFGAWAELISVPAERTALAPRSISLIDAAALPVCGSTALQALDLLDLPAGATLLVLGAGGAVGHYAVQAASARGLRVLGTAAPRHHARLREQGAAALADYHGDWVSELKPACTGAIDGVLDLVGPDELRRALSLVGPSARIVTAMVKSRNVEVPEGIILQFVGSYGRAETLKELAQLVDAGRLTVEVAARYPLAEAAQAAVDANQPHPPGKLLLVF
jgi:NADPH2:quinone reductase